jgi:hypothetical protein
VIGSHASVEAPQHALDPQQATSVAPLATRSATCPYFSMTEAFTPSWSFIRTPIEIS